MIKNKNNKKHNGKGNNKPITNQRLNAFNLGNIISEEHNNKGNNITKPSN